MTVRSVGVLATSYGVHSSGDHKTVLFALWPAPLDVFCDELILRFGADSTDDIAVLAVRPHAGPPRVAADRGSCQPVEGGASAHSWDRSGRHGEAG
jgi:hypothetical protein